MPSEINWGLANGPSSFDNALARGLQLGQMVRQRQDEKEYRNALAQYDPANPETLKPIMQADPRLGLQLQDRQQAQLAQQQQRQQTDMGTFRKLLTHAAQSPEGWQQAFTAAQQMGLDVSQIPQQYDPQWAQQQLFIFDAVEKAGPEALKGIAYELEQAGYQPGTPEFEQAARSVISNKYATEYVDENGNTRRRSALDLNGQPPAAQPYDPNEWEMVGEGGASNGTGSFPAGN